jgi:hypothetical protein
MALSPEPGTWFGLQFAGVFQRPPAALVQEMVAAFAGAMKMVSISAKKTKAVQCKTDFMVIL